MFKSTPISAPAPRGSNLASNGFLNSVVISTITLHLLIGSHDLHAFGEDSTLQVEDLVGTWTVNYTRLPVAGDSTNFVPPYSSEFATFEIQQVGKGYAIAVAPTPKNDGSEDTSWKKLWPVVVSNGRLILDRRRISRRPGWVCDVDRLELMPNKKLDFMRGYSLWTTAMTSRVSSAVLGTALRDLRGRGIQVNTKPFWGNLRLYFYARRKGESPAIKPAGEPNIPEARKVAVAITAPKGSISDDTVNSIARNSSKWLEDRGFEVVPTKDANQADYHFAISGLGENVKAAGQPAGVTVGNRILSIVGANSAQSARAVLLKPPSKRPLLKVDVTAIHRSTLPQRVGPDDVVKSGQWFVYADKDRLKLQRNLMYAALTEAALLPPRKKKDAPPTRLEEILQTGK